MNSINDVRAFIVGILIHRKWQILITFGVVVAAATIGTFLMPKQYETRMKVLVKNERADMVVSADRNGGSGYRAEVTETQINSEIELLNSNDLLQKVVTKSGLDRLASSSESVPPPVAIEKARLRLQGDLKITPVRKANIIQVEYVSSDPHLAAAVLQQVAELYLEAHLRVHGTPGTYEFFRTQAARYQQALSDAEAKLAEYRQRESIVMLAEQKDTMLRKTSDSESALMQAEAAINEYTYKIADTRKQIDASEPRIVTQSRTVPNQYSVERLYTMRTELNNRRTQLLAKFQPDDRLVLETNQEIADTDAALEKATKLAGLEQATDLNPVHQTLAIEMAKVQAELAGMEARRQTLARQVIAYRQQLARLDGATAGYDDLVRSRKEAEENYVLYMTKAEGARIAESLDQQKISNVAIAEAPTEPHLPSKPNVRLNLALGVLLGAFLSLGIAFTAEYFSDTLQQVSDLEKLTGLPVFASITLAVHQPSFLSSSNGSDQRLPGQPRHEDRAHL